MIEYGVIYQLRNEIRGFAGKVQEQGKKWHLQLQTYFEPVLELKDFWKNKT